MASLPASARHSEVETELRLGPHWTKQKVSRSISRVLRGYEALTRLVKTADVFVTSYQAQLLTKFRWTGTTCARSTTG